MSEPSALRRTPLHAAHRAAGARLVPFAGWEMPLDYGSILAESRTVRAAAGLFDVSHMARFHLGGPAAATELDRALGARMDDLEPGRARYSLLLAEDAGILDDLIVYRTGEEEFLLVLNAANRERDRQVLESRLERTRLEDRTEDGGGILALQGPDSRRLLAELTGREDFCPAFLDLGTLEISGVGPVRIARTGYTGEHGYELFAGPGQAEELWRQLLAAGAAPVGLGARDVLRLEAGLPLYGHEIHEGVNPFEAGLRFGVRGWRERDFVGAEALRALPEPERELVGLVAEKRVPRQGYPVLAGGRQVGAVCSGAWSAALDRPIATALIARNAEDPLAVSIRGKEIPVERRPLPFVPHRSRD
ncbi:MAG: glycine cleavage system aminomethyltransferase GcvT [Planctomycetota bacterium]|nr:MAG: glycine cleavage system aminomethyltransferase GcvT [Planctomycetota bacterium]